MLATAPATAGPCTWAMVGLGRSPQMFRAYLTVFLSPSAGPRSGCGLAVWPSDHAVPG